MRRSAKGRTLAGGVPARGSAGPGGTLARMSFSDALRALGEDGTAIWGFLSAAALVLVLTPLVARLAPHIGGIDDAKDRPRVHKQPIPRIGGPVLLARDPHPAPLFFGVGGGDSGVLL